MADAMSFVFHGDSLNAALNGMLAESVRATRPAAQAGAQVLYEEARLRAPIGKDGEHYFYGQNKKYGPFQRGNLKASIYQVYSKKESTPERAVYHISWNTKVGKAINYAPYGGMVEYGTSRRAATPFIRPAYAAKGQEALMVAKARYEEEMRKVLNG